MTDPEHREQFSALRESLRECADGHGSVVVLGGVVGSGRTALTHALCDEARAAEMTVLAATGSVMEHHFPLAVMHQLLTTAPLAQDTRTRTAQLLEEGALAAKSSSSRLTAPVVQGLCGELLALAARAPLVLSVDDAQDIDPQSLECLLFVARRIRTAPVLILLAEREATAPPHPLADAELVRLPHYRRVRLERYSERETAELVERRLGPRARCLAPEWHQAAGGNPVLVEALIEDWQAWSGRSNSGVVAGPAFRRAFTTCLYRLDPLILRVAQALAVLGDPASAPLLGELLDVEPDAAERALGALTDAGLLKQGWFRHPDLRSVLLGGTDPAVRAELHRRSAFLLHGSAAEAPAIARHLAAGDVREPWAAPVLQAAARGEIDAGRSGTAVQWLRLAERAGTDERQRAEAKATLIGLEARLDPGAFARHVPWAVSALRDGLLRGRLGRSIAKYALWNGQADEAAVALRRMAESDDPLTPPFERWLAYWYPGLCSPAGDESEAPASGESIHDDPADGLSVLVDLLRNHDTATATIRADHVLRECGLGADTATVESLTSALTALLYADRADLAARWCEPLAEHTTPECSPMWRALFHTIRAHTVLRQGELRAAITDARTAVTEIPVDAWGVAIGLPLSAIVAAATAAERFEYAARYLAIPVPEAMFRTPAGVHYLQARGQYRLATGAPEAALADFQRCAEFLAEHAMDLPGIAAWRTGAAEAYLLLGRRETAAGLIDEHIALAADGPSRGRALRLRAAVSRTEHRPDLLDEAASILQAAGDRFELALVLADLGRAHHALGDSVRARTIERRAEFLMASCRQEFPVRAPRTGMSESESAAQSGMQQSLSEPEADPASSELSEAELRVAELAALGLTNRQISSRLYITVSTVEQHLTRIYRKLGVTRRAELPTRLAAGVAG